MMQKTPLISVVMPVYNNERYFPIAVQSVLSQNYDDFELVIVDDGSTDNTGAIADSFAKKDSRVKVIHQENQWIYASFNNGIKEAKGEYVYILNSDDKLKEGALRLMAEKVKQYYFPDIIWTKIQIHLCNENQEIISYNHGDVNGKADKEIYWGTQEQVRQQWGYVVETNLAGNQANLYRRSLAIAHPFRNDVFGADFLFNIGIADDVSSAMVLCQPVYDHFFYQNSKMNASVGKYYGYEHEMYNEMYLKYVELFSRWAINNERCLNFLAKERKQELIWEIRFLRSHKKNDSVEEKVAYLLSCVDEVVIECIERLDAQEELESRILSAAREVLVNGELSKDSQLYFMYELLDSLLRYEKNEGDYRRIEAAVNHPKNPYGIGRTFWEKIKKKEAIYEET